MVSSSPTPAHESVLGTIMFITGHALGTIPAPVGMLPQTRTNNCFNEDSICGIPDLAIMMWGQDGEGGNREPRALWLMESAFSQSDRDVMQKLNAYVRDLPDLLVVGKILVKQTKKYRSPGSKASIAQRLRSSRLLKRGEWSSDYGKLQGFSEIVVDGHMWFSLSSVTIHVWVRQHGNSKIDLSCSDGNGYSSGVRRFISFR